MTPAQKVEAALVKLREIDIGLSHGELGSSLETNAATVEFFALQKEVADLIDMLEAVPFRDESPEQQERRKKVDALMTHRGGFKRKALESIGVSWPPKQGWKQKYINGENPNE